LRGIPRVFRGKRGGFFDRGKEKKEINEKEKQLHWKRNRHCVRLHDTAERTKRGGETAFVYGARDWCLLDEKRDLQIVALLHDDFV